MSCCLRQENIEHELQAEMRLCSCTSYWFHFRENKLLDDIPWAMNCFCSQYSSKIWCSLDLPCYWPGRWRVHIPSSVNLSPWAAASLSAFSASFSTFLKRSTIDGGLRCFLYCTAGDSWYLVATFHLLSPPIFGMVYFLFFFLYSVGTLTSGCRGWNISPLYA